MKFSFLEGKGLPGLYSAMPFLKMISQRTLLSINYFHSTYNEYQSQINCQHMPELFLHNEATLRSSLSSLILQESGHSARIRNHRKFLI